MALPIVAIVGRPNVGKSSLLNCLAGRRISIVDPTAGVTRDRVSAIVETNNVWFELVDTGGYGIEDCDDLTEEIEAQIKYAVQQAGLVLFVVDVRAGVVPLDVEVAKLLRGSDRRVILIANKADDRVHEPGAAEFHRLGFGAPVCISALQGRGKTDLLEMMVSLLDTREAEEPAEVAMKLAIVGRRNVGKSTLVNALAEAPRTIVSEVPGTTRDAVDVEFERNGRRFIGIDTAGLRKRAKVADNVEFYAYSRAIRSIRQADVVLFLIDSTVPVGQVDKALAHKIVELFTPCVLVVNKWDLAKARAVTGDYGEYLGKVLPEIDFAPISFMTAKDQRNVQSTIDLAENLFGQASTRVPTTRLNEFLQEILVLRGPSARRGMRRPKMYFATQIGVAPPTIMISVNDPVLFGDEYHRFLLNRFRERLPYPEVPIRLLLRSHRRSRQADAIGESVREEGP